MKVGSTATTWPSCLRDRAELKNDAVCAASQHRSKRSCGQGLSVCPGAITFAAESESARAPEPPEAPRREAEEATQLVTHRDERQIHSMADPTVDVTDEGDLYGDLDAVPLAKKAAGAKVTGCASSSSSTPGGIAPLTLHGIGKVYDEAAMQKLRADNDRLRAENEALKRNIGTLYRTAKAELARKDERIASLQGQVDSKM